MNLLLIPVIFCGLLPSLPPTYGAIIREWWLDIEGTNVTDLTSDSRYPNDPDGSEFLDLFEGPRNWGNDYGSRLYGWLMTPESGEYTFWIASDDSSELWLSTDEDPANGQLIAYVDGWTNSRQWTKYTSQQSRAISLQAGQKYYIEALMKEGGGSDNIAVAWQPPSGVQEVISGRFMDVSVSLEALFPSPADGSVCTTTAVNLSWQAGARVTSHHVYFSDDPNAVSQRRDSALIAVTDASSVSVGLPGGAFTNDLQMGTTYYWCVDEVNDVESGSPWRGQVWSFQIPLDPVAYLLITNTELAPAFQLLVDRRTAQGFPGRLITVEYICEHYPGRDKPEQIRNCIIDHYLDNGLLYVALGGDQTVVPVRWCDPRSSNDYMPVDLYYSDMNGGNWDGNGNSVYGEVGDVNETELTPEVHLGRIPLRTFEQAVAYINKVAKYETSSPDGFANSMICLSGMGGIISGTGRWPNWIHHDPVSQGEWQQMWEYYNYIQPHWQAVPLHFLWDTYSSWDIKTCGDYELTLEHVCEKLNEGYHFIFYYGHANESTWGMEGRRFTSAHAAALTNSKPSIVVSWACSPAAFDNDGTCMSEAFLQNPHGGAVAYFGHTRPAGGGKVDYRELFLALSDGVRTTGEAMTNVLMALAPDRFSSPYGQYYFALHGDPCIQLLGNENSRHLQIFQPKGCEVIQQGSDLIIRWNAAGTSFRPYEAVKLEYSDDSGDTWHAIPDAQSLLYNGCAFTWKECPLPDGSHYRIRVSSLTDPFTNDMSGRDFTITELCFLAVQSIPDANIVITGSYDDGVNTYDLTTDYDISIPKGMKVSLSAPWISEDKPELIFARWRNEGGSTLTDIPDYTFIVSHDMTILAEYGEPIIRYYYVNDDIPENGFASGNDNNDGFSMGQPMRHIQTLLDKYPALGGSSVINISAGVYEENISLGADNTGLQIVGAGQGLTIIDGDRGGSCVSLNNFKKGAILQITVQNGSGLYGGGIWCVNSSLKVEDCAFVNNATTGAGGAIHVDISSNATISNCTFSHNSGMTGGAIGSYGAAEIDSCLFETNSAVRFGGAIHVQSGNMTRILNCTFLRNTAPEYGGGVYLDRSSLPEVTRCTFRMNESLSGGALYNFGGTARIESCLFEANHADWDGGAVCNKRDCTPTFAHCIFSNNDAGLHGGAMTILADQSHATVTNCTFIGNSASNPGGALCAQVRLGATAMNCIFWDNTPDQITEEVAITYCDVQGGWQGQGNIDFDPLFANLASGDIHLKSQSGRWDPTSKGWITDNVTSPCIDAGEPEMLVNDEPEPNGGRINMGTYGGTVEASKSTL
jgi:hypothetical protein